MFRRLHIASLAYDYPKQAGVTLKLSFKWSHNKYFCLKNIDTIITNFNIVLTIKVHFNKILHL